MKPLIQDYPLIRHSRAGGNPARTISSRSEQNLSSAMLRRNFLINWIPACAGMTQFRRSIELSRLIAALLFALIISPNANAANLGRLFFTPEQRTHLDYAYARNAPAEGNSSPFFTVNGIVQKQGGARTVWVNGVSQNVDNSGERTPTAQTVTLPGKSQVVKMKVGDKILLDQPAPPPQAAPSE